MPQVGLWVLLTLPLTLFEQHVLVDPSGRKSRALELGLVHPVDVYFEYFPCPIWTGRANRICLGLHVPADVQIAVPYDAVDVGFLLSGQLNRDYQ